MRRCPDATTLFPRATGSVNCHLCQQNNFDVVSDVDAKSRERLIVSICNDCGLVQQTPMPSEEELRLFYEQFYRSEYKGVETPKPKHIHRAGKAALDRIDFLLSATGRPTNSILDIGAGGGEFVYMCSKLGFNAAKGVEPNLGYCGYAQEELQVDINQGGLKDLDGVYDVVTMFHVLEHLVEPLKVFEMLYNLLGEEGILFIEVPWIESISQSPSNIYFKAHTLYFSVSTLESCASQYFTPEIVDTSTGNLRVLFRKRASPTTFQLPSAASVEGLKKRIRMKGWLRYLVQGKGILRPFQKIGKAIDEGRVKALTGKRILDNLVRHRLSS